MPDPLQAENEVPINAHASSNCEGKVMTKKDLLELKKQPCYHCGLPSEMIELKDLSLGFIETTLRTTCNACFRMKGKMSDEEFEERISLMYDHIIRRDIFPNYEGDPDIDLLRALQ